MSVTYLVAFDIIIYSIAVYLVSRYKYRKTGYRVVWILALTFCLFAAWGGDYFHYQEIFYSVKKGSDTHLETPYVFLIKSVVSHYFFFRLIIWGSALWLFHHSIKKIQLPEFLALYVFIIMALPRFSYARASLAMSIMTFGGVILATCRAKQLPRILLGLALTFLSIFFHKSAAFGVAVVAISLLTRRFMSKTLIIITIAVFPVFLFYLKDFLVDFMTVESFEDAMVNIGSGQRYLVGEISAVKGPATLIEEGLMKGSFYLVAVLFVVSVFKNKYKELPDIIQFFACCSFFTIAGASLFAFDTGFDTSTIHNRFILYSILPSTIYLAYILSVKQFRLLTRIIILVGTFASFFALLYSLYCSIMA